MPLGHSAALGLSVRLDYSNYMEVLMFLHLQHACYCDAIDYTLPYFRIIGKDDHVGLYVIGQKENQMMT